MMLFTCSHQVNAYVILIAKYFYTLTLATLEKKRYFKNHTLFIINAKIFIAKRKKYINLLFLNKEENFAFSSLYCYILLHINTGYKGRTFISRLSYGMHQRCRKYIESPSENYE